MSTRCLTNFQRKELEKSLQRPDLHQKYRMRIQIMLLSDRGKSQAEICKNLGCSRETARHWIAIAEFGQAHRWHDYPLGRPNSANQAYLERLKELVQQSPRDCGYPFRQWTARALRQHLAKELDIELSDRHVNRLLKQMGLSTRGNSLQTASQSDQKVIIQDLPSSSS